MTITYDICITTHIWIYTVRLVHPFTFLVMKLMPTSGFTCSASSDFGKYYRCNKVYDNHKGTSWFTNRQGVGAWISIRFHSTYSLSKLELRHPYGGVHANFNIKDIKLAFSEDGQTQYATLSPSAEPEWNVVNINPVVKTSFVKIEFKTAYISSTRQLRGFSEMKFYEGSGNT